jgi:hypothetical protein
LPEIGRLFSFLMHLYAIIADRIISAVPGTIMAFTGSASIGLNTYICYTVYRFWINNPSIYTAN